MVVAVLGVFYRYAGGRKLVPSQAQLEPMMGWGDTVTMPAVRAIGALGVLGVAGLVLPPPMGVAPGLAVAAAIGCWGCSCWRPALHLSRGEARSTPLNWVLVVLRAVGGGWPRSCGQVVEVRQLARYPQLYSRLGFAHLSTSRSTPWTSQQS